MGWDVWVGKICTFLSSVSSQQKFEAMDGPVLQPLDGPVLQPHVTVQFYLESKGKYILEACGWANPKESKRSPQPNFGPTFYMFFFLLSLLLLLLLLSCFSRVLLWWQPTRLPVPGILQARTLEVHWTHSSGLPFPAAELPFPAAELLQSCLTLCDPIDGSPPDCLSLGCHFLLQCMRVKSESEVLQSCLTPSDPMDCSLPGFSVHWIFQARVLEWG